MSNQVRHEPSDSNPTAPFPAGPYPTGSYAGDTIGSPSWPPPFPPWHPAWGPPPPGWTGNPPAPPQRGRSQVGVVVAAIIVVLAVVGGALVYAPVPDPALDPVSEAPPATTAPVAPPDPTPAAVADVSFTITDSLASFETAESVTVYSFGEEVGTLRIGSSAPTDELAVTSRPGEVDYQLQIAMVLTDRYGGRHVTLNGAGSITAYEGARYYVDIVQDASGHWVAALSPVSAT